MRSSMRITILAFLAAAGMAVLAACAAHESMSQKHPVELTVMPICSTCHTDWRSALDHRPGYIDRHKNYARQRRQACNVCHAASFCADCHTNKEEILPSEKNRDAAGRTLPHRGDWLVQHRIEGKINPATCFVCHGRQNNARCKVCHR